MILNDCLEAVTKAAGRELTQAEIKSLSKELEKRTQAAQSANSALSHEDAALQAADSLGKDAQLAAAIEKRNAFINLRRRTEGLAFVKQSFADNPAEGLRSLLTGSQRARVGARRSVASEQEQLRGYYLSGLLADIEKTGSLHLLASGAADRDIARALWRLEDEAPDFKDIQPEAVELAKAIRKWQEIGRQDANKSGAWIGKLPGYVVRQSHDMWKIREAGFEKWRDEILPKLDLEKTAPETDNLDDFLREVYTGLATGQHLKVTPDAKAGAFKGPANLAKKLSQERTLFFKDADAWSDYNAKFGTGNLREAVFHGMTKSADSTGLMRVLGTNPASNFDAMVDEIAKGLRGDIPKLVKFSNEVGTAQAPGAVRFRLAQVDGSTRIPVNQMLARASGAFRGLETLAKLGGSLLSSFSDIPVYASEMKYQGKSFLSGMADAFGGLLKGRAKGDEKEILSSLGVVFDHMVGDITRWGAHDDSAPGRLSRMQQTFFKLNLQSWWTDSLIGSAALSMSHDLGQHMGKEFGKLRPELQRVLSTAGISEAEWNAVTKVEARTAEDGRAYLTPEAARHVSDTDVPVKHENPELAEKLRGEWRENLESKLRSFFLDRTKTAVLHPDAETLALMRQGTKPGTVVGEAARFIGQFKSFSISYLQKIVGREIYGRGSDTLAQAMRNGNGEMLGLANIILWSTVFGYGAMATKDLLKGRNPRDPENYKTWMAALAQGGGLGIYGDFMFGESNRMGGGLWSTALGPSAGTVSDLYDLYQRVKSGDDAAAQAFRVAINNTPFLNLFYTRTALDYLLLYRIQEAMNPGYLRRMQRNIEKQNAQTFWLPPTSAVQ